MSRKLRFDDEDTRADAPDVKPKKLKRQGKPKKTDHTESNKKSASDTSDVKDYINNEVNDSSQSNSTSNGKAPHAEKKPSAESEKTDSNSKLKFSKQERKVTELEQKSTKYNKKLEKAREKIPSKKIRKKQRVFDEKTQKTKTKLSFEKEQIPINEAKWNKPKKKSLPKKGADSLKTAAVNKLHSKVYEAEHENVGTQAAHQAELIGESAYRGGKKLTHSAYRFVRNHPYRKASKLETKSLETDMKLSYQKALRDNPKLTSNPVSRFFQKRSIKKEYADAIRNAKKSGNTAKKAVGAVRKTGQAITGVVRKNPVLLLKAGILLLIVFMLLSLISMCGTIFSGTVSFIGATSYTADDSDIDTAELSYTEWETDLQIEIQNAESTHSGYDEYRYHIGDIGHDPFELMGFLTAVYDDFTYDEIQSVLQEIFDEQYTLEYVPEVEIRTRTELRTDTYINPATGEPYTYTYQIQVEYEWHILNINLTSQSFSDIVISLMSDEQCEHFEILMQSKGNRQYVSSPFDFDWLPYVTSYYGYRIHPISGEKDYHKGIDIGVPLGTEIKTGLAGTVTSAGYDAGYGNYVVIEMQRDDGTVIEAKYAHCDSLLVSAGQTVNQGDIIATVGNTGNSTSYHLHLEIVKDGEYLNPIYHTLN